MSDDPTRDRELDRFAVRDHVMRKALEDIAQMDAGGALLDTGSAARRAAWTLEKVDALLPGAPCPACHAKVSA